MNKSEHLKYCKSYLRKIVGYRRNLIRLKKSKLPDNVEMAEILAAIDYQVGTIVSFDKMMSWLSQQRVRSRIFLIIPSNKQIWRDEYERLIFLGQSLENRINKNQLQFSH